MTKNLLGNLIIEHLEEHKKAKKRIEEQAKRFEENSRRVREEIEKARNSFSKY